MVFFPSSHSNIGLVAMANHTFIITDSRAKLTDSDTGFFSAALMSDCLDEFSNPETACITRGFKSWESVVCANILVSVRNVSLNTNEKRSIVLHILKEIIRSFMDDLRMFRGNQVTNFRQFGIIINENNFSVISPGRTSCFSSRQS